MVGKRLMECYVGYCLRLPVATTSSCVTISAITDMWRLIGPTTVAMFCVARTLKKFLHVIISVGSTRRSRNSSRYWIFYGATTAICAARTKISLSGEKITPIVSSRLKCYLAEMHLPPDVIGDTFP